jgi:hypothetical protein
MALSDTTKLVCDCAADRGSKKAFNFGMFSKFRSSIVKLEGG